MAAKALEIYPSWYNVGFIGKSDSSTSEPGPLTRAHLSADRPTYRKDCTPNDRPDILPLRVSLKTPSRTALALPPAPGSVAFVAFSLCQFLNLRFFMPAQKSAKPPKTAPDTAAKAVSKTAAKAPAKAAPKKAAAVAEAADAKKVKNVPVKSTAELIKAADELLKKKPARAKAAAAAD
jgi:hypothetical protein